MTYAWHASCNIQVEAGTHEGSAGLEKRRNKMKTKLLALLLLAGSSMFAGPRFFVGVGVGPAYIASPPPAPVVEYAPAAYRPGYSWVGGYYYPVGPRWNWHAGYYARPPYAHSYWVAPRYYEHRYYGGYWRR